MSTIHNVVVNNRCTTKQAFIIVTRENLLIKKINKKIRFFELFEEITMYQAYEFSRKFVSNQKKPQLI
jgi:hypothetical protein